MNNKNLQADSEIAYSQLPSITDPSDSTIFSVVDSASNFKLNINDLKSYLVQNTILRLTWSASDTVNLMLTEDQIKSHSLIKITINSDLSTLTGNLLLVIPSSVGSEFSVKFEIDYSAFVDTRNRLLTIEQDSGPIYYDSFLLLKDESSTAGYSKLYPKRFTFEIEDSKFRRPYGSIGATTGSGTAYTGGLVPANGGVGMVDNSGLTYRLGLGFYGPTLYYRPIFITAPLNIFIDNVNINLWSFNNSALDQLTSLEAMNSYVSVRSDGYRGIENIITGQTNSDAGADLPNTYSYSQGNVASVATDRQIKISSDQQNIIYLNGELLNG